MLLTQIAAAAVSGLGAYFLGHSSVTGTRDDDPVKRVTNLKRQLEFALAWARDGVHNALWNFADADDCPPGTLPPGFSDGDEVPCGDTSSNTANTVIAIDGCYIAT